MCSVSRDGLREIEMRGSVANQAVGIAGQNKSKMLLTSREQNVVQLIAEGQTNRSISVILKLSVKTVETHRASAMRKLGMSSTAELVRYAIRKKLVAL
jgi:DNA-binding NarL/FixJ family response regulator